MTPPKLPVPKLLLTVDQAAATLSVSRNTVYRLIAVGDLHAVDIDTSGRRPRTRLRMDEIQRLVEARTQKSPNKRPA